MPRFITLPVLTLFAIVATPAFVLSDEPRTPTPQEVFEQRIMPIFKSPKPASCVQCHLAGVDLKSYILPSHEQTFASLRDLGMIDLDHPKKSKILTLIAMGEKDADKGAKLIHEKTRKAEYEAFESWIIACCQDPKLRELPKLEQSQIAKPARPDEVIRHARKSRVVDSFVRNIWSQRMRCFPCHTPHELDPKNPLHEQAIEKHKGFLEQDNKAYAGRMILFRETPEATVQYLIEQSQTAVTRGELPLINLKDPARSLLVLKPTAKLPPRNPAGMMTKPSNVLPVSHLGGLKMHVDDQSYKAFIAWIQDYSNVVGDKYTSVADLPADNWQPTKNAVVMREVPASWPEGVRVQFFVHAWNEKTATWEARPLAFTQGLLTPRRSVAGMLFALSVPSTDVKAMPTSATPLAPGKHKVKVFIDRNGRLAENPTLFLGDAEFAGEVEIQARWEEGFPKAEVIPAKLLK